MRLWILAVCISSILISAFISYIVLPRLYPSTFVLSLPTGDSLTVEPEDTTPTSGTCLYDRMKHGRCS
jgi:hypothetical protein